MSVEKRTRDNDATTSKEDCLGCRISGTVTLAGVSAYFLHERSKLPMKELGHRRWLLFCGTAFAAASVLRAFR